MNCSKRSDPSFISMPISFGSASSAPSSSNFLTISLDGISTWFPHLYILGGQYWVKRTIGGFSVGVRKRLQDFHSVYIGRVRVKIAGADLAPGFVVVPVPRAFLLVD